MIKNGNNNYPDTNTDGNRELAVLLNGCSIDQLNAVSDVVKSSNTGNTVNMAKSYLLKDIDKILNNRNQNKK